MHTIEIDFDVFKRLTSMRESETVTYNEVLRNLLGLSPIEESTVSEVSNKVSGEWTTKAVSFPAGTEFRATYKGQTIYGRVEGGALNIDGKRFISPSSAAMDITGSPVNGWIFWECRIPGKSKWQIIKSLRG